MFKFIKNFFKKKRTEREAKEFANGFVWAKGEHLNGVPVEDIEAYTFGNTDHFDQGANEYLRGCK